MASLKVQKEVPPEFRQRAKFITSLVAIAFVVLWGRLFFLQVLQGERFAYLAEKNRIRVSKIPGPRGMVFDRKGQLLADSRPSFELFFVPEDSGDPEATLRNLARFLGRKEDEFLRRLGENGARPPFEEIVLGKDLDWRSVVAVEARQLDLPGVTLRIRPRRSYEGNSIAAHLLGYVGEINRNQLKVLRAKQYGIGDEIGQFGLEKSWEEFLRGLSGGQQVEVDALGRRIRVLNEVEVVPGQTVSLTIDRDLQETAHEALRGKEGAIVVLDVHSGAVLAMASAPAFDPNMFARGVSAAEWQALLQDPLRPLQNRAIQGQYPPGSTFKIVLVIAALEEGLVDPQARIFDPGYFYVGSRRFRDWKPEGHGFVDLHRAIVESCDIYFYQLGMRLGVDRIAKYARALGLGEKTGILLDDEKPGLVPDTEWKWKRFGQKWFPGETPSLSIGQGYVTATPLQMANLMAAVANGGTLYRPYFVAKVESLDGKVIQEYGPKKLSSLALKETTLRYLREALRDVVETSSGTGARAKSAVVEIAGKTGTAQVAEMRGAHVKSAMLPYRLRDHAWFLAYAPAGKPEIAVAVLIEHGGGGGAEAAPIAKKVIEKYFSLKREPPEQIYAQRQGGTDGN